ncbi:hypothetical protein [Maribacter sp. Asnod2-G09]|uniref:hypothetical protein n=1 Tax=Maribacter sp. Asnod2-G09 TaxID=3160577 RepID=UPI0038683F30
MKTPKKILELLPILFLLIAVQSCTVDIPDSDITPPEFSFQIHGDDFFHTFDQDTDFENIQLRLKTGTTYNFTLAGSDDGGLERIQWINNSTATRIATPITSPWTYEDSNQTPPTVSWFGDSANPVTGSLLTGNFTTHVLIDVLNFQFIVADYGGETRDPNYISKRLNIYTSEHGTALITQ